jgi:glycerophosphoryl diester phosphodiesterase
MTMTFWNATRLGSVLLATMTPLSAQQQPVSPYLDLMQKAAAHAKAHNTTYVPALSPDDKDVFDGSIPIAALQARGVKVIPWNPNAPEKIRAIIRTGIDGLISDRPDILQKVLAEERASSPEAAARLKNFNVQGHRGGRDLRPENTLPAFESGLDNLIDTIETDTGVTRRSTPAKVRDQVLAHDVPQRVLQLHLLE